MKKAVYLFAFIGILAIAFVSCKDADAGPKQHGGILAQTFKTSEGWGYMVYVNDKLFIKQSYIPAIAGNKGFDTEADAIKVATLVVEKLKSHQKPTIQIAELQKFGVVK